jgi:hypothetical protein
MKDKLLTSFLFAAVFLALGSTALATTTWHVNGVSGNNSKDCKTPTTACKTIRHAIALASSGDSIMVAAATYKENLTVTFSLKILGSGASTTIINGGGVSTVVTISSATAHVTLSGVTIYNGRAFSGAGIFNIGTLTVMASTITGNKVLINCSNSCGVYGGGISNVGTLLINGSTVYENQAGCASSGTTCAAFGGGISNAGTLTINHSTVSGNGASVRCLQAGFLCGAGGGGIASSGMMTINRSTISGNVASGSGSAVGGGISNGGTNGLAIINNSTLSGNSAKLGGGISNGSTNSEAIFSNSTLSGNSAKLGGGIGSHVGSTVLQNSIVANSPSGGNCYGAVRSWDYNISSDDTCKLYGYYGDENHTNPKLGPLQNNGGQTQTMALLYDSPAINAGNPAGCRDGLGLLLRTDQRGDPRDTSCDIGAYERQRSDF